MLPNTRARAFTNHLIQNFSIAPRARQNAISSACFGQSGGETCFGAGGACFAGQGLLLRRPFFGEHRGSDGIGSGQAHARMRAPQ